MTRNQNRQNFLEFSKTHKLEEIILRKTGKIRKWFNINPSSIFRLKVGLQGKTTELLVEYSPLKWFIKFFLSVVDARIEQDENPICGIDAESMILIRQGIEWGTLSQSSWRTIKLKKQLIYPSSNEWNYSENMHKIELL